MKKKDFRKIRNDILDGKVKKWDLATDDGIVTEKVHGSHGYFGAFIIIPVGGKKTLIFIDDRDGICVPMLAEWYDDLKFTGYGWDPDARFVSNPNKDPLLVCKDGKWTMVGYYGETVKRGNRSLRVPYCNEWYDSIGMHERVRYLDANGNKTDTWCKASVVERWYDAMKDGVPVRLTNRCRVLQDGNHELLAEVKKWDKGKIISEWIAKGRPCYSIYGYRYKGAKAGPMSNEEAMKLIGAHSFGIGYSSLSWAVEDGQVALVFEHYSEGDLE